MGDRGEGGICFNINLYNWLICNFYNIEFRVIEYIGGFFVMIIEFITTDTLNFCFLIKMLFVLLMYVTVVILKHIHLKNSGFNSLEMYIILTKLIYETTDLICQHLLIY